MDLLSTQKQIFKLIVTKIFTILCPMFLFILTYDSISFQMFYFMTQIHQGKSLFNKIFSKDYI